MSGTSRSSRTHFSRIARRLNDETGMGYQKALAAVQEQAGLIMQQGPRLDGAGCDFALRMLLQQDLELWGPGIAAHPWPQEYQPVSMNWSPAPLCDEAMKAAGRAGGQGQVQACGREFDPSYLAAVGVEPLDYGGGPHDDEDDWDDLDDWDEASADDGTVWAGADDEAGDGPAVDEPDHWKRHVLTQGVRAVYRLPNGHRLTRAEGEELRGLPAPAAAAKLEALMQGKPATVEAYVRRADLALAGADPTAKQPGQRALDEARRWYECAVAVGEVPLHFPLHGAVLPWQEESNQPLLRALYGLALVANRQKRWNAAELILLQLLYLDPEDEQQAASLLGTVRQAAGIAQPGEPDGGDEG